MIKDMELIDNIMLLILKDKPSDNLWADCADKVQELIDYIRAQKKEWDEVEANPIEVAPMSEDELLTKIFS